MIKTTQFKELTTKEQRSFDGGRIRHEDVVVSLATKIYNIGKSIFCNH
jgi:hypothetical protein